MPLYEYRCRRCTHRLTAHRDVDERNDPLTCPGCEKEAMVRVFAMPDVWAPTRAKARFEDKLASNRDKRNVDKEKVWD